MGVEYMRYLVPESDVRPTVERLVEMVAALTRAEFLPGDDEGSRLLRNSIATPIGLARLRKYPARRDGTPAHRRFDVAPFADTAHYMARQPSPIVWDWVISATLGDGRVGFLRYPLVAVPNWHEIDYTLSIVAARDMSELEEADLILPEGVDVPFAVGIDCGKSFDDDLPHDFAPDLRACVESVLGVRCREVEEYY